jgi:hypothetical protein
MTKPSTNLPPFWVEVCAATVRIRDAFGLDNALRYLIGEKFFTLLFVSERDPERPVDLLKCAAAVRRIFTDAEIRDYLQHLKRSKYRRPWVSDRELGRYEVIRKLLS